MFEGFRGTEYGWVSNAHLREYILQSYLYQISVRLLRNPQTLASDKWRREAIHLLNKVQPGWRMGGPMAQGEFAQYRWHLLRTVAMLATKSVYPMRRVAGHLLEDERGPGIFTKVMWYPAKNYSTTIVNVMEIDTRMSDAERFVNMLRERTGHVNFEKADKETKDLLAAMAEESRRNHQGSLSLVTPFGWLPKGEEEEQREAEKYRLECNRYQASIAGRRAKRLLLENLRDDQISDYYRQGYFFVVPRQDAPIHERRVYAIERGFPNGNVYRVRKGRSRGGRWFWYPQVCYCFHTEEPHAIDDILLGQKLMLENEEDDFLAGANATKPLGDGKRPMSSVRRSV